MSEVDSVIEALEDLKDEEGVSKTVKDRIDEMISTLQDSIDLELRVDRVRSILDDMEQQNNIPNYVRTQLWNVAALLELV